MWIMIAVAAMAAGVPAADEVATRFAPNEIALHIVVQGTTRSPADAITVTVTLQADAPTAAAAHAAVNAKLARLTTALLANGIDRSAITSASPESAFGFVGNAAADDDDVPPALLAAMASRAAATKRHAAVMVKVRLTSRTQLDKVTSVLDEQDETVTGSPAATLTDPRPAQRAAIADAVQAARRQADDYAATLGLKVARVVAVSNAPAADNLAAFNQVMAAMQGNSHRPDEVVTTATVAIDFALARP